MNHYIFWVIFWLFYFNVGASISCIIDFWWKDKKSGEWDKVNPFLLLIAWPALLILYIYFQIKNGPTSLDDIEDDEDEDEEVTDDEDFY